MTIFLLLYKYVLNCSNCFFLIISSISSDWEQVGRCSLWSSRLLGKRWSSTKTHTSAHALNKVQLAAIGDVLTRYCSIDPHEWEKRSGIFLDTYSFCSAFARLRLKQYERPTFNEPSKVVNSYWSQSASSIYNVIHIYQFWKSQSISVHSCPSRILHYPWCNQSSDLTETNLSSTTNNSL